jgi:selenocysteine-specific elongation factor
VDESEARGVLEALAREGELETLAPSVTLGPPTPAGARAVPSPAPGAGRWFLPPVVKQLRLDLAKAAADRAKERPERPFSAVAELAAAARGAPPDVVAAALAALVAGGVLVAADGGYGPAGATGVLDAAQEDLAGRLAEAVGAESFAPPTLALLAERERLPERDLRRVLDVLARRDVLVRVDKDLWFTREAVDEARARLVERLETEGRVTLAEFRDLLGCGRRNAQALLEHFDREGLTRRAGDARVARRRGGQ